MRPLAHPALDDISLEGILHALSDPRRAAIFMEIAGGDCAQTCSAFAQVGDHAIPKSTLSHHFKTLREAGLTERLVIGGQTHQRLRTREVEDVLPGVLTSVVAATRA